MSLKAEDCTADLEGVTPKQLDTLGEWVAKFEKKYRVVGKARAPHAISRQVHKQDIDRGVTPRAAGHAARVGRKFWSEYLSWARCVVIAVRRDPTKTHMHMHWP